MSRHYRAKLETLVTHVNSLICQRG